ncbi:f-box and wd domain containing protein [Grosmannia clavigera kw1407]|uniref:F-box and wd domain containing protein n=1 Tax=Grosmannia clavigera (strain kw1407 / UAMH 11150) TaxID=655863 RepID=F0X7S2_GROCL|nr:f-box and wd domain containing protein [Grosmannia clavigera kw1407]EFX06250.1 f-box and wd domain containing protein [Grosmannia clavigera kw1407]
MDSYQPQQPDEGYSEDPLTGPASLSISAKSVSLAEGIALLQAHFGSELSPLLAQHISSLSLPSKIQLTESLLEGLPTCVVAELVQKLNPRLYIDFIRFLPAEICLKILEYLDPLSLISAAKSCRAWYSLALDRKLWERLYYLEGWKIAALELQAWEENINRDRPIPSAGGHALKKRAISASRRADNDLDHVMVDADRPVRADGADLAEQDRLDIFGNPVREAISKGKGKERAVPSFSSPYLTPSTMDAWEAVSTPDRLPKSSLWLWDSSADRYRVNWRCLYSLRRRLEENWDQGKFVNFQFPHPDHPEDAHNEGIYIIQFTSDYLVSGSRDCTIRIWNMQTRRLVRAPLTGHRGSVLCLQFDADPEEDMIISGSSDTDVILWRFSTGKILQRLNHAHQEPVLNVKFDKRILVTCSKDRTIKIFNRRELRPGDLGYGNTPPVHPVPIHLKDYGNDGLDQLPIIPPYSLIGSLEGHSAAVNAVQIHDREVVSASGDRNVKIWDWPNQTCTRTFLGHNKGIACVQYDGRRIVSGSSDNVIKVFDSHSGVEVASLRSHSHLVRTVQAGFGDLPYSVTEDAQAAAKVDEQYYKAVQDGTLTTNAYRRRHRNNDGSGDPRPENLLFAGAKLPPGGGGGKYGRIVSGSYDTTVIIWRRDKEGMWRAQHHFKQEEAAVAAAAAAAAVRAARQRASEAATIQNLRPVQAASVAMAEAGSSTAVPTAAPSEAQGSTAEGLASAAPQIQQETIDGLIAQGAPALQHALVTTPALLAYHNLLHASIDRQPSPFVRSQLRQAVSTAIVRAQYAQHNRPGRRRAASDAPGTVATGTIAGPSGTAAHFTPGIASSVGGPVLPSPFDAAPTAVAPAALAMAVAENVPLPTVQSAVETAVGQGAPHLTAEAAAAAAAVPVGGPFGAGAEALAAARPHHPHIPHVDASNSPRVYKLQFDARRIICCCQTSVIVGWDFCNGDAELEEAARFFGTVD